MQRYCRYMEGRLAWLDDEPAVEFDRMTWWDAAPYAIDGEMGAAQLHAIAYLARSNLRDCLVRMELEMGFKVAHPTEPETRVSQLVALQVRRGTGPLSQSSRR